MAHSALTDETLMARVQEHADTAAFAALYHRHSSAALATARRVCGSAGGAEEAVQDAFVDLWRNRHVYNEARASVRTWILRIVHNRSVDALRRENVHASRRQTDPEGIAFDGLEARGADAVASLTAISDLSTVRAAVQALPADQYRVLDLAYFLGLTHRDIADITGVPLGTVKGRIRLGLDKLHRALIPVA